MENNKVNQEVPKLIKLTFIVVVLVSLVLLTIKYSTTGNISIASCMFIIAGISLSAIPSIFNLDKKYSDIITIIAMLVSAASVITAFNVV
jgi:hypothetical protein